MDDKLDLNENNYVVKANKFIEAKGKLNTLEQKLLATLISEIQPQDGDFKEYDIAIKDIGEFIGLNTNALYERLKEAAISLKSKSISLEEIDPISKKRTFLEMNLIASAKHTEKSGILKITIAPDLKPYLLAINGRNTPFTKYLIANILKLDKAESIRLYELLKQCEKMKIKEFKVDELKEMLGIEAVTYKLKFSEFERKILKDAKNEINEKTDIWIDYKKIKEGRNIAKIKFFIDTKITKELLEQEQEKEIIESFTDDEKFENDKMQCGLADVVISKVDFYNLLDIAIDMQEKYAFEYMALTAEYVIEYKPKYFVGYFKNALKNNYIKF